MSETECCRTCLSQDDLYPIFLQQEHCERYTFALFIATGLQIEYDDNFPQTICKTCIEAINAALKFRRRCHESVKTLLQRGKRKSLIDDSCETNSNTDLKTENLDDASCWSDDEYVPSVSETITKEEINLIKDEFSNLYQQNCVELKCKNLEDESKSSIKEEDGTKIEQFEPQNGLCLDVNTLKLKIRNSESAKALREDKKRMFESLIVGGRRGNGPFECKICGKVLKIWSSFRTHAKIHVGFDFMCEHCGKKFVAVTMLRRHLMALHGAEKTYICKTCGHKEHNSDRLKIHMRRMHTGERPYICDKCGADFFSRRYLIFHLTVHETQRNYQCQQCTAKFKSSQRLACHVSKVHRLKNCRLGCYLCECSYTKCENVKRHVIKVHGADCWHKGSVRRITVGAKAFEIK